jgi:hypothetical protein
MTVPMIRPRRQRLALLIVTLSAGLTLSAHDAEAKTFRQRMSQIGQAAKGVLKAIQRNTSFRVGNTTYGLFVAEAVDGGNAIGLFAAKGEKASALFSAKGTERATALFAKSNEGKARGLVASGDHALGFIAVGKNGADGVLAFGKNGRVRGVLAIGGERAYGAIAASHTAKGGLAISQVGRATGLAAFALGDGPEAIAKGLIRRSSVGTEPLFRLRKKKTETETKTEDGRTEHAAETDAPATQQPALAAQQPAEKDQAHEPATAE